MQEAEIEWGTYTLEVCLTFDETRTAYRSWEEKAQAVPGAEVRFTRLLQTADMVLYTIVTQSAALVPPSLLRFHEEIEAGMDVEKAAWRMIRRTGYGYLWPHPPGPPVVVDLTAAKHPGRGWEAG